MWTKFAYEYFLWLKISLEIFTIPVENLGFDFIYLF